MLYFPFQNLKRALLAFCVSLLPQWLSSRKVFQFLFLNGQTLENSRHFATPSLVSTRNDDQEKRTEISLMMTRHSG